MLSLRSFSCCCLLTWLMLHGLSVKIKAFSDEVIFLTPRLRPLWNLLWTGRNFRLLNNLSRSCFNSSIYGGLFLDFIVNQFVWLFSLRFIMNKALHFILFMKLSVLLGMFVLYVGIFSLVMGWEHTSIHECKVRPPPPPPPIHP